MSGGVVVSVGEAISPEGDRVITVHIPPIASIQKGVGPNPSPFQLPRSSHSRQAWDVSILVSCDHHVIITWSVGFSTPWVKCHSSVRGCCVCCFLSRCLRPVLPLETNWAYSVEYLSNSNIQKKLIIVCMYTDLTVMNAREYRHLLLGVMAILVAYMYKMDWCFSWCTLYKFLDLFWATIFIFQLLKNTACWKCVSIVHVLHIIFSVLMTPYIFMYRSIQF